MTIQHLIETVQINNGRDLSVYSASFLKKTLAQRVNETASPDLEGYLDFIAKDKDELTKLTDSLHINFTLFFRNTIDTALLEGYVLPELIQLRQKNKSRSVRIWSVGCADGPEAFSLAILADKVISDRDAKIPVMVFGSDISTAALETARKGTYERYTLQNTKLSYIDRYFTLKKSQFAVIEEIRTKVDFSPCDIIDAGFTSPPAAIFADFDLVSCCNLMIYYHPDIQQTILDKLYRSLGRNGLLLVGESERLTVEKFGRFRPLYTMGNIFIKQ